jgi:hypothetical protein
VNIPIGGHEIRAGYGAKCDELKVISRKATGEGKFKVKDIQGYECIRSYYVLCFSTVLRVYLLIGSAVTHYSNGLHRQQHCEGLSNLPVVAGGV